MCWNACGCGSVLRLFIQEARACHCTTCTTNGLCVVPAVGLYPTTGQCVTCTAAITMLSEPLPPENNAGTCERKRPLLTAGWQIIDHYTHYPVSISFHSTAVSSCGTAQRNCRVLILACAMVPTFFWIRVAAACTARSAGATRALPCRPTAPDCSALPCCMSTCCTHCSKNSTWGLPSRADASHVSN